MNKLSQAPTAWRASDTRIYPPRPYPASGFVERTDAPGPPDPFAANRPSDPTPRNRRKLVLVLVGIAVIGAAVLAYGALTGGSGDSAATAACKAETSALRDAQESYKSMTEQYGDLSELQVAGLETAPRYHEVVRVSGREYVLRITDARCGVPGHEVGQTPTDH